MNSPSFSLPPCPACSSTLATYRPQWKLCRHTSNKSGKPTFALIGCRHAAEVSPPTKFRDDPAVWEVIEDTWAETVKRLFAEKTADWPQREVERFQRILDADTALPGTIKELNLTAPKVPQPNQKEETINHDCEST